MEEINRVALSHVQMEIGDHARGWKFFVRPSGVEVTDLLWLLEDIDIPEPIRLSIPTLTQAEWEAALRFSFLFIGSYHVAVDPGR